MKPLKDKELPPNSRCIVALDFPCAKSALALVDELEGCANFYKVGLELLASGDGRALVDNLVNRGHEVFVDLKLFDVPETVKRATQQIAQSGARFLTVHGNDSIMQAAVAAKGEHLKILAVTVLTSFDQNDLNDMGYRCDVSELVVSRAKKAAAVGCDGVICSGNEVAALRRECGTGLALVVPGIRLDTPTPSDDQKRVATPLSVMRDGGSYIVVGRPIKNAPNPRQAFGAIAQQIEQGMA